jgi:hypothetical protein
MIAQDLLPLSEMPIWARLDLTAKIESCYYWGSHLDRKPPFYVTPDRHEVMFMDEPFEPKFYGQRKIQEVTVKGFTRHPVNDFVVVHFTLDFIDYEAQTYRYQWFLHKDWRRPDFFLRDIYEVA